MLIRAWLSLTWCTKWGCGRNSIKTCKEKKMKWKEGWSSLQGVNLRFRAENCQQRYTLFLCTCKRTIEGTAAELKGRKRHSKHNTVIQDANTGQRGEGQEREKKFEVKEPKGRDNRKTLNRVSPASGNTELMSVGCLFTRYPWHVGKSSLCTWDLRIKT